MSGGASALRGPETPRPLEPGGGAKKEAIVARAGPDSRPRDDAVLSGDLHTDAEDLHATACAVYAVLLGATDAGSRATGAPRRLLGEGRGAKARAGDDERVVALIRLGPAVSDPPDKERAPLDDVLSVLP